MKDHLQDIQVTLECMQSDCNDDELFESLVGPLEKQLIDLDNRLYQALCNAEITIDED